MIGASSKRRSDVAIARRTSHAASRSESEGARHTGSPRPRVLGGDGDQQALGERRRIAHQLVAHRGLRTRRAGDVELPPRRRKLDRRQPRRRRDDRAAGGDAPEHVRVDGPQSSSSGRRHAADGPRIEQIAPVQPVRRRHEMTRVRQAARRRTGDQQPIVRPQHRTPSPCASAASSRSIAATSVERCHGKPQVVVTEIRDVAAARLPQAVGVRRRLRPGVRLPVASSGTADRRAPRRLRGCRPCRRRRRPRLRSPGNPDAARCRARRRASCGCCRSRRSR